VNIVKKIVCIILAVALTACGTLANTRVLIKQDLAISRYDQIKAIAIEEAARNGFSEIASEVRPSEHNNWRGRLFFQLKTPHGTDQLFIEFRPTDGATEIYIHGAGLRSNPNSAAKAIASRLRNLQTAPSNSGSPSITIENKQPENTANIKETPNEQQNSKELQKILNSLGFNLGVADGIIGSRSRQSIIEFQKSQLLEQTGRFDEITTKALVKKSKEMSAETSSNEVNEKTQTSPMPKADAPQKKKSLNDL
jgi:hypothetical protein